MKNIAKRIIHHIGRTDFASTKIR